jgi:beta-1,4-mannosyl-glycoprotein beta-1,4-N-acetylglucosaminyltransferase
LQLAQGQASEQPWDIRRSDGTARRAGRAFTVAVSDDTDAVRKGLSALTSGWPVMSRVFDCFTFFNELDVLDIRFAELDPLVDHFVIVEATRTFTAKPKPLYFVENRARYERYAHKIIHVVVDDIPLDAPTHWAREAFQRDAIMRGLTSAKPDDVIVISDCDEIPKPALLQRALRFRGLSRRIVAFWCDNYFYRLNLRDDAHDHRLGPRLLTMGNLKSPQVVREIQFRVSRRDYMKPLAAPLAGGRVFRRLGTFLWPTIFWHGAWHFTNIGDVDALNLKFSSFSHADEYDVLTDAAYHDRVSALRACPLTDLPATVRQDRFARLIAQPAA